MRRRFRKQSWSASTYLENKTSQLLYGHLQLFSLLRQKQIQVNTGPHSAEFNRRHRLIGSRPGPAASDDEHHSQSLYALYTNSSYSTLLLLYGIYSYTSIMMQYFYQYPKNKQPRFYSSPLWLIFSKKNYSGRFQKLYETYRSYFLTQRWSDILKLISRKRTKGLGIHNERKVCLDKYKNKTRSFIRLTTLNLES